MGTRDVGKRGGGNGMSLGWSEREFGVLWAEQSGDYGMDAAKRKGRKQRQRIRVRDSLDDSELGPGMWDWESSSALGLGRDGTIDQCSHAGGWVERPRSGSYSGSLHSHELRGGQRHRLQARQTPLSNPGLKDGDVSK